MSMKEVFLEGNPPWGFRMNGGADAGHPLRISRVNPGSKAEAKGVREGDLITSINGQSTKCLTNSESHALLRTVKENLLLGLNEEKNASPRRRSREIKSASIINQDKERSESPAQHKGKVKSSSQKRHQRRTRLKHRIKEILGFKSKEKKDPSEEGWVIIDTSLNVQEAHSVSELTTDDEKRYSNALADDETITNGSEEIYDSFDFKKSRESSQTPLPNSTTPLISRKESNELDISTLTTEEKFENAVLSESIKGKEFQNCCSTNDLPHYQNTDYSVNSSVQTVKHEKNNTFDLVEGGSICPESNKLWLLRTDNSDLNVESEAHICEGEDFSETINAFSPGEMVEICNATIMIEDDNPTTEKQNVPLVVLEEDDSGSSGASRNLNPDYEPVEVTSSVIVYPPYSTTLSYYFPQKRFLEAISEENSDLSESNEEKHDKPWENSELIKKVNNVPSIPNDWYGSDEGIDTSWRDGKSLEEASDVAVISDSFSDSDLISDELKLNRGVSDDGTIKYSISKSRTAESSKNSSKSNIVKGKPPIRVNPYKTELRSQSLHRIDSGLYNNSGINSGSEQKISKTELKNKNSQQKVNGDKTDSVKVTCRIVTQNEVMGTSKTDILTENCIKSRVTNNINSENLYDVKSHYCEKPIFLPQTEKHSDLTISKMKSSSSEDKVNPKTFLQKPVDPTSTPIKSEISHINLAKRKAETSSTDPSFKSTSLEKKYMKSTPSSSVLKNVVFSYYNDSFRPKKNHKNNEDLQKSMKNSCVELSTDIVKAGTERDIELIYIDSSDSDAFSNKSTLSPSNRTSVALENDTLEEQASVHKRASDCNDINKSHIIKEEITNINQSVKQISDICSSSSEKLNSKHNAIKFRALMLPNLLSPVFNRKMGGSTNNFKRRFSYPLTEMDILKKSNEVSCFNCNTPFISNNPNIRGESSKANFLPGMQIKEPIIKESPTAARKLSLRSLPNTPPPTIFGHLTNKCENQSTESILLEFSDGSVSSESYTLPDVTLDNDLSDVSSDTIKYFHKPTSSPQILPHNAVVVSEIVDLHKKFVERRGYHEASPVLKRKTSQGIEKTPEPDIIALSKCQKRSEQAYTPELLAEAANLLALHKYHESRQKKMKAEKDKSESKDQLKALNISSNPSTIVKQSGLSESDNKIAASYYEVKVLSDPPSEIGMNEKIIDYKQVHKSVCTEHETVGKSRLLELFQKLESKSSTAECTTLPDSDLFPFWFILGDKSDLQDINKLSQESSVSVHDFIENDIVCDIEPKIVKQDEKQKDDNLNKDLIGSEKNTKLSSGNTSLLVIKHTPLPPGEIFQRKMYEEYLGKMAELAERRNMKIIKVSSIPNSANVPSESQPLESEFMTKLKERNEKLGIVIDKEESYEENSNKKTEKPDELPKHLKELMEITEECGGVWSPAQTPEAERKKFNFSNEIKEEKEREKQKEEEEKSEPTPPVWTPRSAGASPTLERKFRTVNFQSPPPTQKEIKTPNDTPELPKNLPIETEKDSKSRLTTSSSENSTLSSSLRLPAAQNPTITLLQKAREGHIPRGAHYLEEQPIVGPDEIIYSVKKEHVSEDQSKKIVELGPRKIEGIGPTTKEGIPIVLRSEVKEDNQQRWYKRMYDSLHKADFDKDFVTVKYKTRRGQYPYSSYAGGYSSEPERLGYDSDVSLSKYATLDRRKIRNKENDFTTSTMPRNRYAPDIKYAVNVYKNQPGRIEDYEPGNSSISDKEKKQWWDEVMDIFDGELNETRSNHLTSKSTGTPYTYSLKDTGYESDSTLVFKRRENNMSGQLLSPTEQKMAYKVIQKGGEVPFQGLRKAAPERPKEPLGNPIPTPPRDCTSRQRIQESPHRYVESEVNIHYKSPIRRDAKPAWPEDELAQRQAEIMRRIYQEQKRTKYLNELHDMYSRRHADNLLPSQKSPIPLNRYDDFPVEVQPPRPRDRTPEPKLVARALYNFVGQTSRELSFRRGDIIYVRRQIDKNWYEGEHNAMIGLFPFNYVEIIPYDGIRTLPKKASEGQARAKFNFQAKTHLELSLVKGELVLLTRRVDENWFEGRIGNRKGIFPVSYVEVLVEPGERAETPSRGSTPSKPLVAPASHSVMLNGAKDLGQQHYQPPRPTIYSSSSLPPSSKIHDISMVNQTLHIDTQSDPVPYRVMYNYRPQNEDELELKEGDIVYVMEKCDDGWYVGSLHRNGQFGTFPGNYVERIQ